MTANFGHRERRTMASQPSVHNEERNRLRLRAWEQRNQETSQTKDLNTENIPLFGEPYKTSKGDELSNRIQRMLGRYEDVNNASPVTSEPSPVPAFSQSDQAQLNAEKSTKPPFHEQVHYMSTQSQTVPSSSIRTSTVASSPSYQERSSTLPNAPLNHSQDSQKKGEAFSDLRECAGLPQELSARSPDGKPLPFLHSSDHENTESKGTHRHQMANHPSTVATTDISGFNPQQSPKDASLPQASLGTMLLSQAFPPLLSSKQPNSVVTQKPTAYVRPMDGQDQVVNESPQLKPSPEPYTSLQEIIINKSDNSKSKKLPQFLETRTNESLCVEDILREMTHSWPPLLTAIHIPSTDESPAPAKEVECVSSCSGQKNYNNSPTGPSHLNLQSSSCSLEAAHSSGGESASSSDSESSSGSESDSESAPEEPVLPRVSGSKTEPDAPAVARRDWQLGNWIPSSQQQSAGNESQTGAHISGSPSRKQLQPAQSAKRPGVEVTEPKGELQPQPPPCQFSSEPPKPHNKHCQQSSPKPPPSAEPSGSRKSCANKPAKDAAAGVKSEEAARKEHTDRPKVKTKEVHCKKNSDAKRDRKRTLKHTSLDKRKAGSEPACTSCGAGSPHRCSCPAQDAPPPTPLVVVVSGGGGCGKHKPESKKDAKASEPPSHKHSDKSKRAAKNPQELAPPRTLLVKIDLRLLSRIPPVSGAHQMVTKSALVTEREPASTTTTAATTASAAAATHKHAKNSKKSIHPKTEVSEPSKKRRKLEKKDSSSASASVKLEGSSHPKEDQEPKKAKKNPQAHLPQPKDTAKDSRLHKRSSGESAKVAGKSKEVGRRKRSDGKHSTEPHVSKKSNGEAANNRPLLQFEDRQYPVKHYIKEAKRLKHKADAESDKLSKAFNYLDAAMFFVESGIAMERDPQISMSSYTMFADTVDLLKFVLKLKNSVDSSAPPTEKDFSALCLRCQSLLQMAMFHHKQKTALKYSKTLTDLFNNSAQATQEVSVCTPKGADTPSSGIPSPAGTPAASKHGSGGGLAAGPVSGTVVVPQAIQQAVFTYVNVTTLFLTAHDVWEQAEELANKGSGMLAELDTTMGPLSLTSSVSSMVRYIRQGVLWLRLDSQKVK